jgi:prolyl-tRNA synthetase
MFNISFQDPEDASKHSFVYQNSWGLSTRTIGAMVMVHADDKGLVLPPKVAAVQVVVIPVGITVKTTEEEKSILLDKVDEVINELVEVGIRAEKDNRDHVTPGWKFNHWELMGVPIRVEIGPRDLKDQKVTAVLRWNQEKHSIPFTDLANGIRDQLEEIHLGMYQK